MKLIGDSTRVGVHFLSRYLRKLLHRLKKHDNNFNTIFFTYYTQFSGMDQIPALILLEKKAAQHHLQK